VGEKAAVCANAPYPCAEGERASFWRHAKDAPMLGTLHCAEGQSVRYYGKTLKTLWCQHATRLHHATPGYSHHHGRAEQEERECARCTQAPIYKGALPAHKSVPQGDTAPHCEEE